MGPNIRMPRTWVSLPFMWFARMMTWRMYACIGLLKKKSKRGSTVLHVRYKERNAQSFAVVGWFRRDVKGDPTVRTVERDRAHLL